VSTSAQIAANQANAQHSTGPRTEEGKAASSHNNFRYGFTGAFLILPWEKQEEFESLLAGLREEHQPSTTTEAALVDKMAQSLWPYLDSYSTFDANGHPVPGAANPLGSFGTITNTAIDNRQIQFALKVIW